MKRKETMDDRVLQFTENDLKANRAGQLTAQQRSELDQEDIQQSLDIGCALLIFAVIGALIFVACALLFNIEALLTGMRSILPLILVMGAGVVLLVIYANFQGMRERSKMPDVSHVDGTLRLREAEGGFRLYLDVGDKSFRITDDLRDALQTLPADATFRVYYATKAFKVLSLEPL